MSGTFRSRFSSWLDSHLVAGKGSLVCIFDSGSTRAVARGALTSEDGGVSSALAVARALDAQGHRVLILGSGVAT